MLQLTFSYEGKSLAEVLLDLAVRFILNCPQVDLGTAERLFFQVEEAHWFYDDFARADNPALPWLKFKSFAENLFKTVPLLKQYCNDPDAAVRTFQSYKSLIPVRGGIILNDTLSKVLMVKGWNSSSSWGFPKGKINKDEPDVACAIREVQEETGFDMTPFVVEDEFIEMNRQGKNIRLYVVYGVPHTTKFETQTRKEISKIEWHDLKSFPMFNKKANTSAKFSSAAPFMNGLKRYISQKKGHATSLSSSEAKALKNVLGPVEGAVSDEDAAKKLLSLLKAPANEIPGPAVPQVTDNSQTTPNDRQILLDLIKGGEKSESNQIESAKEIIDLFQNKMAAETALNEEPAPIAPTRHISAPAQSIPAVPPNAILGSLLTSRKTSKPQNTSSLLSLLTAPTQEPVEPPQNDGSKFLLSLLQKPDLNSEIEASSPALVDGAAAENTERDNAATSNAFSLMDLLNKPSEPQTASSSSSDDSRQQTTDNRVAYSASDTTHAATSQPRVVHGSPTGTSLLDLLIPTSNTSEVAKPAANEMKEEPKNTVATDGSSDDRLLNLLHRSAGIGAANGVESNPEPLPQTSAIPISLLSLLDTSKPTSHPDSSSVTNYSGGHDYPSEHQLIEFLEKRTRK